MSVFMVKGGGKIRLVTLTARKRNKQRIRKVETISPKGPAPKRYSYACCAPENETCVRCHAAAVRPIGKEIGNLATVRAPR